MPRTNTGRKRPVLVILVVAAAIAGTLIASGLASGGSGKTRRPATKSRIAVFAHHPKLAHVSKAGSLSPPQGAILAAVVDGTDVYALQKPSGDDCVIHLTAGGKGGSICGLAAKVEEEGEVGVGGGTVTASGFVANLQVSALVPNGVTSLTFTDRNGASYDIPVTNNVVEHEDSNVASVRYTLPGGAIHSTNVAAIVDQIPRQPGPPGSSQ